MARRNNFLVITLLVMVAVLIGAILLGKGDEGPTLPDSPREASGIAGPGGPAAVRQAEAGMGEEPESERNAAAESQRESVPTQTPPTVGRHRLSGRLVFSHGKPAVGIGLDFEARTEEEPLPPPRARGRGPAAPQPPQTRTDTEGRFTIEIAHGARGVLSLAREHGVIFQEGDRRRLVVDAVSDDRELGPLTIVDGLVLRGQVFDDTGRPLPEARLRLGEGVVLFGLFGEESVVDGEGRFEVRGLEPGSVHLTVSAVGFVPEPRTVDLKRGQPESELRFDLKRGASIAGVVYDDLGRPLGGAKVTAMRRSSVGTGIEVQRFDARESVETAANGSFVLAGIEGDSATLRVSCRDHATESVPSVTVGRADVVVQLPRVGAVRGVLRDPQGAPLVDSEVRARTAGREVLAVRPDEDLAMPSVGATRTDENGAFEIAGVRPGSVTLTAEGPGHLPIEAITVQVPPGGVVEHVQLVAEVGAAIDALVVDAHGAPVAGAEVAVARRNENAEPTVPGPGGRRTRRISMRADAADSGAPAGPIVTDEGEALRKGTTGADGRVKLGGLPGGALVVRATHAALAPAKAAETLVPLRGSVEVILTMRPAGHVQIAVRDRAGKPVPGARFVLNGPEGDDRSAHRGAAGGDGTARVGPLLAGHYTAALELPPEPTEFGGMRIVMGESGGELVASRVELDVRAGETADIVLVRPLLTRLEGVVTDASGPVRGAELRLSRAEENLMPGLGGRTIRSDAEGRYAFDELTPGKWRIEWKRANRPVSAAADFEILPETPSVQKDLRIAGGTVRVHVRGAQDQLPLARAEVTLNRLDENPAGERRAVGIFMMRAESGGEDEGPQSLSMQSGPGRVRTDDEGAALLEEVPPGEYVASVEHPKHSSKRSEKLVVVEGQETDAGWVVLEPAGNIRGKVTGLSADDPIGGAMIVVKRVDRDDGEERRETAMGGSFRIDRLAPGEYELRASALGQDDAKAGPPQRVTVRAGEVTRIDLAVGS